MEWLFPLGAAFAAVIVFAQFGMRYVFGYDLVANEMRFLLLGKWIVYKLVVDDIEDMREGDPTDAYTPFAAINARNRIVGNLLVVTRCEGLIRDIVITPDEPTRYLDWFDRVASGRG